ncbi:hypothetical protein [Rhodalgimonas zhirmunskyi]|uniref:EF-hand domain-containing protein n=1 Tax=Rhodalgimonas zhirmunskyi TaxID=2964767 RepID=A0AAJ1X6L8_9RHOB|nr:hypothetical protein [Rhodoalgimonas zhirmunskyi]MDQ2094839.1 hypothetical protein [Rhodoalgimonas zhirmunskyi]
MKYIRATAMKRVAMMGLVLALGAPLVQPVARAEAQSLKDALNQQLRPANPAKPKETQAERDARRQQEYALQRMQREIDNLRSNPEKYRERYLSTLFQLAPDGELTQEDVLIDMKRKMAQQRGRLLQPLLQLDLDADALVSMEELEIGIRLNSSRERSRLELLRLTGDANGDGQIDLPEMMAIVDKELSGRYRPQQLQNPLVNVLLGFDGDGDGTVTSQEVLAGIDALVAAGGPTKP